MCYHFTHINDFFYPHVAGPTNHIIDVIQNTFLPENHSVVSFDYTESLPRKDQYRGIPVDRYAPISDNEFYRFIQLGNTQSETLSSFVHFIRSKKPTCVILYFIGIIPVIIRNALPEVRVVFMPFGFKKDDYQHMYRNKRVKIALCGDGSKMDYLNEGADSSQIYIIERPIDTNYFTPLKVKRDPYRLLFVGRFHPMKRIPELIEMLSPLFKDYSALHLHIVADTQEKPFTGVIDNELEHVQSVISKYSVSDRVIIRGKLEGEDLLREYSEASIHVLPSNLDRRATVVQEAITMGMQCVNTCKRAYDWPEYAEDGRRLIHYAGEDVESMAPVIRNLLESGPHPSNRDYALKHWSWEKWKPEYEKLMTEW